jgi:hypothetical protein
MKKGCFIIVLVLITVVIAAVIYFFKYREGDIVEVLKPMIVSSVEDEINKKISEAKKNAYSDSLKTAFDKLILKVKKESEIDIEKADLIFNSIRFALSDKKIDSLELSSILNQMKMDLRKDERPKKN